MLIGGGPPAWPRMCGGMYAERAGMPLACLDSFKDKPFMFS
jgi:hypothetical protein